MTPDDALLLYRDGLLGSSVRGLHLEGASVAEVFDMLEEAGFAKGVRTLLAERTRDGRPQWLLQTGDVSEDPRAPGLYRYLVFAHADHGLVEVYIHERPARRLLRMVARKYVLFRPAVPLRAWYEIEPGEDLATAYDNRVFAVGNWGGFVPKSARSSHGMIFDPDDLEKSHRLAVEVQTTRSLLRLKR